MRVISFSFSNPSSVWTVNHESEDIPFIEVLIDTPQGLEKIHPLSISHADKSVTIAFSLPRTGKVLVGVKEALIFAGPAVRDGGDNIAVVNT